MTGTEQRVADLERVSAELRAEVASLRADIADIDRVLKATRCVLDAAFEAGRRSVLRPHEPKALPLLRHLTVVPDGAS